MPTILVLNHDKFSYFHSTWYMCCGSPYSEHGTLFRCTHFHIIINWWHFKHKFLEFAIFEMMCTRRHIEIFVFAIIVIIIFLEPHWNREYRQTIGSLVHISNDTNNIIVIVVGESHLVRIYMQPKIKLTFHAIDHRVSTDRCCWNALRQEFEEFKAKDNNIHRKCIIIIIIVVAPNQRADINSEFQLCRNRCNEK